ncbi:hypothetical protein TIFTF001_027015 [Ficus carica]|uniref:Uncharacterized protein n=1 Tax=Ficus carica TaxID=3494 RepID=A0AA88DM94_FICCA|nr:hypothetical protein TIFTF001_027015 [Ficus carica]
MEIWPSRTFVVARRASNSDRHRSNKGPSTFMEVRSSEIYDVAGRSITVSRRDLRFQNEAKFLDSLCYHDHKDLHNFDDY